MMSPLLTTAEKNFIISYWYEILVDGGLGPAQLLLEEHKSPAANLGPVEAAVVAEIGVLRRENPHTRPAEVVIPWENLEELNKRCAELAERN